MWIYVFLIVVEVVIVGLVTWKLDSIFEFFEKKNKEDLEWELRKYKKQ